jgi:hypothetical protein
MWHPTNGQLDLWHCIHRGPYPNHVSMGQFEGDGLDPIKCVGYLRAILNSAFKYCWKLTQKPWKGMPLKDHRINGWGLARAGH